VALGIHRIFATAPRRAAHVVLLREATRSHLADGREVVFDSLDTAFDRLQFRGAHAVSIATPSAFGKAFVTPFGATCLRS
jgi:hypothetical protein